MARETLAEDHTSDQVSVSEPLEVLGVVREGDIFPEAISFDVRMPQSHKVDLKMRGYTPSLYFIRDFTRIHTQPDHKPLWQEVKSLIMHASYFFISYR